MVEDSLSDVEGSVAGYNRIRAEIDALGGLESNGAAALLDAVAEDEMPTMCPTCATARLDAKGGNYLWSLTPSLTTYGVVAAQLARDHGYSRVALLGQQAGPWEEWLDATADTFRGAWQGGVGGEITAEVRFVPRRDSYTAEVQQVLEGNPEALFLIAAYGEGDVVISDLIDSGYEGTILVSPDLAAAEIAELAAELPEGQMLGAWVTDGPAVAAQVPRVLNAPGTKVYTYADGVAALERGEDIDYDGASGSLDLNEHGNQISPTVRVLHIVDGRWFDREIIQLDPNLSAAATVGSRPEDSVATTTWPDFVPTDVEWEPATILTFEGSADEIVPVYDSPEGERLTFQDGDQPSAAWFSHPLPLVVRVVQGSEGDEWAEVELPVRPNGSRGWIRTAGFAWSTVDHHIFVDLSERRLAFFDGDELILHTGVIIGKPATPTPTASGFIVGKLPNHDQQAGSIVYGDWILPVSFFSEALNSFAGDLPRVILHGTHIPERVGEALTNFEVRMPNEIVEIIAAQAPIGTTVRIAD